MPRRSSPISTLLGLFTIGVLAVVSGCAKEDAAARPLAGAGASRGNANQAQIVEVIEIARRDVTETLNLVGSLAANESAEMRAEIGGIVRGIYFEEGQTVQAGAMLLKIDDSELRAQFSQVEARYNLARLNVDRSESLSETRTISQSEVDRARSEFAAAQAEMALIKLRLEKTEVKAPFDGVVGSRTISPGDYITPSTVITNIDDLSRLKIAFQVPERFLAKVKPGTLVRATTRATTSAEEEHTLTGEVYFVSATIDRSVRASEVKAILRDASAELRPGMFANIELILDTRENVFTVPEGAILASSRGIQIITVAERDGVKVANFVPVRTGLRTRGQVEVEPVGGELASGTEVVASGVGALILFPGAPVDPRPLRAAFNPNGDS